MSWSGTLGLSIFLRFCWNKLLVFLNKVGDFIVRVPLAWSVHVVTYDFQGPHLLSSFHMAFRRSAELNTQNFAHTYIHTQTKGCCCRQKVVLRCLISHFWFHSRQHSIRARLLLMHTYSRRTLGSSSSWVAFTIRQQSFFKPENKLTFVIKF